jgi:ATP-binding cassette, subfamily B, bacterial
MKTISRLARQHAGQIVALMALEALGAALAVLGPIPIQIAVDVVVQGEPLPGWLAPLRAVDGSRLLGALAVLAVVVAFLSQAEAVGSGVLSTFTGERLILRLRTQLFSSALRLPLKRHIDKGVADSLYRIQTDAQAAETFLLDGALPIFASLMMFSVMLAALFRLSPLLGAVGLGVAPPLLFLARRLHPALKAASFDARERESQSLSVVDEALGALPVVKAFGREGTEVDRYGVLAQQSVRARMRVSWLTGLLGTTIQLLCAAGSALGLFLGIRMVQEGRLTLGQALLGLSYLSQIYGPLRSLGRSWAGLQTMLAGLTRATVLLEEPAEAPEHPDAIPLSRARGEICFRGVTFGYDERRPVLEGVSLIIAAGQRIGIVGETGSGKTTLLSLLLRFHDPGAGEILLDGVDLRRVRLADLRRQLAVVFQETVLFQGTIAENIAVGRPGATTADIESAARGANLHDTIGRLPDGYSTQVGECGHALSGGERQRVGLARAFLRDAPIVVLDEPTSALDAATESLVLEALERLMAGRTVLLITHRRQALHGCDRVVRVEDGKLREESAPLRRSPAPR